MADLDYQDQIATPTQTTGDESRKETLLRRYRRCRNYYQGWIDESDEDLRFALGDQWELADKEALNKQARPCLTFNRISPIIDVISGYQRENEARLKVRPEGGEDKVFSDVIDRIMMYIDKMSKFNYKLGYMSDDGSRIGKGVIEAIINYDDDPIRGELSWRQIPPRQCMVDPDNNEYDINKGAEFVMKVAKYTRAKLKTMFPEKEKIINTLIATQDEYDTFMQEGDRDNYGNNPNKTTVVSEYDDMNRDEDAGSEDELLTLIEEWYKKYITKYFVVNRQSEDQEFESFDKKEQAEAFATEQGGGEIFERKVPQIWVSSCISGELIQDVVSPLEPFYNGFPFFIYKAKWSPSASTEALKCQSVVRALKDPQKEKNKSHSQMLHILNTQANTGWIGDEQALSEEGWKSLEQLGSTPNVIIKQRPGSNLREVTQKPIPSGQINREAMSDAEFKAVSGLNPDLMGVQDKTASGRAISLRIKQAVMILVPMFQNYRYTKEIMGKFILRMIPHLFDPEAGGIQKLKKILGQKYLAEQKSEQMPEGLTDGVLTAYMAMVKNNKYDIEVAESDKSRTMRSEIFEQMVELAKTQAGQFLPAELLIDYMDISNSEEIKQQIVQARQAAVAANAQK